MLKILVIECYSKIDWTTTRTEIFAYFTNREQLFEVIASHKIKVNKWDIQKIARVGLTNNIRGSTIRLYFYNSDEQKIAIPISRENQHIANKLIQQLNKILQRNFKEFSIHNVKKLQLHSNLPPPISMLMVIPLMVIIFGISWILDAMYGNISQEGIIVMDKNLYGTEAVKATIILGICVIVAGVVIGVLIYFFYTHPDLITQKDNKGNSANIEKFT